MITPLLLHEAYTMIQNNSSISHLSVSSIGTFLRCPRSFRLRYIDKVHASFRSSALAFGSAWHAVAEEHLLRSTPENPVPVEELQGLFRSKLEQELTAEGPPVLFDEGEDLDTLAALGARMIEVFVVKVPLPDEVRAVELPFSVDIVDPDTGEVLPVPLIGAVDALVVENGRFYVWELKSGKKKWAADQLTYDLQPTAYKLGMKAHDVEIVHAMLVLTTKSKKPDVQIEELVRNENDERDLVATAASVIRGVEAGVDHPVRGWQCRSCPYAGACR